tara:strand:+ start:2888 stop:3916 length:1029 start_codon:yes stop_codon:yes gene_type:complete
MKLAKNTLIDLANYLDGNGLIKEADQVDSLIRKYALEFSVNDPVNILYTDGHVYPGVVVDTADRTWPQSNEYKIQWGGRFRGYDPEWVSEDAVSRRGDGGSSSLFEDVANTVYTTPAQAYGERGVAETMSTFVEESSEVLQEQWNEIYDSIDARHLEILSLVWKLGSSIAMFIPVAQPAAAASLRLSAAADVSAFLINVDRGQYIDAVFNALAAIITVAVGSPLTGSALKGLWNWIRRLKGSGHFIILSKAAPVWFVTAVNSLLRSMTDILATISGEVGSSFVSGFIEAAPDDFENPESLESTAKLSGLQLAASGIKSEVDEIRGQIDVSDAQGRGSETPPV